MRVFFPRELARLQYLLRLALWIGLFFAAMTVIDHLDKAGGHDYGRLGLAFIFGWVAIKLLCLDVPRLRNIGWTPWALLFFFVPICNAFLQLFLFTRPAEEA